jgi:hypothetical protein
MADWHRAKASRHRQVIGDLDGLMTISEHEMRGAIMASCKSDGLTLVGGDLASKSARSLVDDDNSGWFGSTNLRHPPSEILERDYTIPKNSGGQARPSAALTSIEPTKSFGTVDRKRLLLK